METILATKLHRPAARADFVPRTALLERLDAALNAGSRLTLVSASAGYGKTTLVCEWLANTGSSVSWLSLDAQDNEHSRFFTYLTAALKGACNAISDRTLDAVREVSVQPLEAASSISADLMDVRDRLFLVLDDYHVIQSKSVHQAVQFFAWHLPPAVHLVLITRADPPIAISRLRAGGQITEIRIGDLRFSKSEAAAFFSQTMRLALKPEKVNALERRTEGWAAGLQLAALAIRHTAPEDVDAFVDAFGGNHKYIIDYLVEEVLNHLSPELRRFLTETSLLERFCAPLCGHVLCAGNCAETLLELEKSNLFLIPLDDRRVWFRYHHLFADSLASRLQEERKYAVYQSASEWFDANGRPREAAEYGFLTQNPELAFSMVEKAKTHMFEHGPLRVLVEWLDRFPDERVLKSETLCVNKAVACLLSGELPKFFAYMKHLDDSFFSAASADNKARILYLRALLIEDAYPQTALDMARQGLVVMGESDAILKAATMNLAAGILISHGPASEAAEAAISAYEYGLAFDNSFNTMVSLSHYANSLNLMLRRTEAVRRLKEFLFEGIKKNIAPPSASGLLYITLANLQYEANELDEADANLTRGLELYRRMGSFWLDKLGPSAFLIKYALGKTDEAMRIINDYTTPGYLSKTTFDMNISALQAHAAMLRGNMADAQRWAAEWELAPAMPVLPATEAPCLTYARLLLLQGNPDGALEVLRRTEESAALGGRLVRLIPLLLLRANILCKSGKEADGLTALNRALDIAAPENYLRAFLDEPEILPLLSRMDHASIPFIQKILDFAKAGPKTGRPSPGALSAREMDLLREMALGLSNQEIADKLYISLNTVQWHISHIFSKLGVKNRVAALKKAQDKDLI